MKHQGDPFNEKWMSWSQLGCLSFSSDFLGDCRDHSCAFNMEKLLEKRIHAAVELRRNLGLPSVNTNAYRLINSEGDRYTFS